MTIERSIRFASRFNPGDLDPGEIKRVKALPDSDHDEHMLGVIYGYIHGVSYGFNPNDPSQASMALIGFFEGVPVNVNRPAIQAPKCFLPSTVQQMLQSAIEAANDLKPPEAMPARGKPVNHRIDQRIPIKFEIGVRHSAGSVGFEYITNSLIKTVETENMLAEFRGDLKLPEPVRAGRALPAPKKASGKKAASRKR